MKFIEWIEKTKERQESIEEDKRKKQARNPSYDPKSLHRGEHCGAARYVLNSPETSENNYMEYAMRWANGMAKSVGKDLSGQPPHRCIECYAHDTKIEDFDCPLKKSVPQMLRATDSLYMFFSAVAVGIKPEDIGAKPGDHIYSFLSERFLPQWW